MLVLTLADGDGVLVTVTDTSGIHVTEFSVRVLSRSGSNALRIGFENASKDQVRIVRESLLDRSSLEG